MVNSFPGLRSRQYTSEESPENVDRIVTILNTVIDDKYKNLTKEDGYFWDSCYPWIENNLETSDLLTEAYQHFGMGE